MRGARRWLLLAAVLVLAVTGIVIWQWPRASSGGDTAGRPAGTSTSPAPAATSGPASAGSSGLPDPAHRMLLGTFIDLAGQRSTQASVDKRETAMGRPYDLQLTYYDWNDPFPEAGDATIAAHRTTPLMTWYGPGKNASDHRTVAEINDGSDDAWIRTQATAIKDFGHRIYLRLMPEMNGSWYHGFGDPAEFIAAWRHVHRVFAEVGATNVTWVWCPNINPAPWDTWYPGNAYVDVIAVDGFSNLTYGYQSFQQMFEPFLTHFAGRKPLLIAETATNSGTGDASAGIGSAASYIDGMHSYLRDVAGPKYGVIGVCWFDTDNTDKYDWRVDQTAASWQAWLALAKDPYFGAR